MSRLKSINFPNMETELSALFDKLQRFVTEQLLVSGALAIHGTGSPTVKTGATAYYMIDGVLHSKSAADLTALSGTVTNAKFNVFVFMIDASGTVTVAMGTEAATLAGVVFPTITDENVVLGFVIINPTGTGNFVGGTTNLDDATVVPNAVYVNTVGGFNPALTTL